MAPAAAQTLSSKPAFSYVPSHYTQKKDVPQPQQKDINVALFGGGPSSIIPLVLLTQLDQAVRKRKLEHNVLNRVKFYGNPIDSLILRGRDAQKTVKSLADVASRFGTFEKLLQHTTEYYHFLHTLSSFYNVSLEDAVEVVYSEKFDLFQDKLLFRLPASSEFVEVTMSNLTCECFTSAGERTQVHLQKTRKGFYAFVFDDGEDIFLRTYSGRTVKISKEYEIEYMVARHGDLHYIQVFFEGWEELSGECTREDYGKMVTIDRAGFKYPGNHSEDSLAQLNLNFVELCLDYLSASSSLTPLERQLKKVLSKFIVKYGKLDALKSSDFVVLGGGRAAGEVARRLSHDVTHKNSVANLRKIYSEKVREDEANAIEAKYNQNILKKKKNVVGIDHRRIPENELSVSSEKVQKLAQCSVYFHFLREISDHGVAPTLSSSDEIYYRKLLSLWKELSLQQQKTFPAIKLLEKILSFETQQSNTHFRLMSTESRHTERWSVDVKKGLEELFEGRDYKVLQIGGATHKISWPDEKCSEGFEIFDESDKYELGRIQDSHFRQENLKFIGVFFGEHQSFSSSMGFIERL